MEHHIVKSTTIITLTLTPAEFNQLYASSMYHAFEGHSGQGLGHVGRALHAIAEDELGDHRDVSDVARSDLGAWR